MVKIKDQDILETFVLGEKNPGEKILHGILRRGEETWVVFERASGDPYPGFLEKSVFEIERLTSLQIQFLKSKGYELY